MTVDELKKVERYLRRLFANETISVKARPRKDDSGEVFIGEEFIGVIYRDDEDDGALLQFHHGDPRRRPEGLASPRLTASDIQRILQRAFACP